MLRSNDDKKLIRYSQLVTLIIGVLAIIIASSFQTVLDAILYAYSFMVSGLFVPTVGAYFWKKSNSTGAFWSMLLGGGLTLLLLITKISLPFGLDPSFYGILISAITFVSICHLTGENSELN